MWLVDLVVAVDAVGDGGCEIRIQHGSVSRLEFG